MITYLKRLTDERDSLTQAATALTEKAAGEDRDLTDTEKASMKEWETRCAEIDGQLTEYSAQAESQRAYAKLRSALGNPDDEPSAPQRKPPVETRGWGESFVESDAFKNYMGVGTSGRVEVPFDLETRAAISIAGMPTGWPQPYIFSPALHKLSTPLIDAVGKVTTSANSVEYLTWDPNPPSEAAVVAEEAAKPEATITPVPHSATLQTYAHYKGITRQALEDIPQIRSIVENKLRGGILRALDTAVSDALTAATLTPVTNADLLAGIRVAVATVQSAGFADAQVAVVNPADLAAIDLAVMGATAGGPVMNTSAWGVRFIPSASVAEGTAFVGDLDTAVTLFSRGTAAVFMSDSHSDYFIKNILVILAEMRALVAVTEPAAVAEVTVTVTP